MNFKKLIITQCNFFNKLEFEKFLENNDIESVAIEFSCLRNFDFRWLKKLLQIDTLTIFENNSQDLSHNLMLKKNFIVCDKLKINTIILENFDYRNILDILPLLSNPFLQSVIAKNPKQDINKYFRILKKEYLLCNFNNHLNFYIQYYGVIDNECSLDLPSLGKRLRDFNFYN